VRIGKEQEGFVEVDRDEDGVYDGWIASANLSPSFAERPQYLASTGKGGGTACLAPTSSVRTSSVR
jgi:hypothetical protein